MPLSSYQQEATELSALTMVSVAGSLTGCPERSRRGKKYARYVVPVGVPQ
ncbi:hypothetical protein [Micromonospora sp. NPDC006431]